MVEWWRSYLALKAMRAALATVAEGRQALGATSRVGSCLGDEGA
jgi:hypothetical protein